MCGVGTADELVTYTRRWCYIHSIHVYVYTLLHALLVKLGILDTLYMYKLVIKEKSHRILL